VGDRAEPARRIEVCERDIAKPGIKRWTRTRFAQLLARDGRIDDPGRIMSQVLETRSVNLISSQSESRATARGRPMDLPQTFFVDSEALTEVLGLQRPPRFTVSGDVYRKSLTTLGVRLTDERGFSRMGDTHFAFAVPERAFEDRAVLEQALEVGLLTRRLATCLLMTDFPNPVFSRRRAALLAHVPPSVVIADGRSDFSEQMGDAIAAVAPSTPAGSPEREFAERWDRDDDDVESFAEELRVYYATVTERLRTQEGYDDYVRLAESRRACVRDMPIFENELLLATTDIPPAAREMRADGTVVEV
jgi:hypothetical protein